MDKDTAIWTAICLLVGVGVTMTGWISVYLGYGCLFLAAILATYQTRKWWIRWFAQSKQQESELGQILTQHKSDNSMPLSEVVENLRKEGLKQTTYGYSLDSTLKLQNPDKEYDRLARLISKYIAIYGKHPSSPLGDWVEISEEIIGLSDFRKLASELHLKSYIDRGAEFIDFAINKNDFKKAIDDVLLYEKTLYQG